MKFGRLEDGTRISADDASKGNRHYCPGCNAPLILKQGAINEWHFAHENGSECDAFTENKMTEWHIQHQKQFPSDCVEVRLEKDGVVHIADVMIGNLIIEFQHSPMDNATFEERSNFYSQFGRLLWVFDRREQFTNGSISWVQTRVDDDYGYYKWTRPDRMLGQYDFKKSRVLVFIELGLTGHGCLVTWNPDGMKYFNGRRLDNVDFMKCVERLKSMTLPCTQEPVLFPNAAIEKKKRIEQAQAKVEMIVPLVRKLRADCAWGESFLTDTRRELHTLEQELNEARKTIDE